MVDCIAGLSVQDDTIARQELPLTVTIGLDHEVPLPGGDAVRGAPVASAAALRHLERLIGPAVDRTLEPAEHREAGERRAVPRRCIHIQPRRPIRLTLDMSSDLPVALVLAVGG